MFARVLLSLGGHKGLLIPAKALRDGKGTVRDSVYLVNDKNVLKVLNTAGTDALIPIFETDTAAAKALET